MHSTLDVVMNPFLAVGAFRLELCEDFSVGTIILTRRLRACFIILVSVGLCGIYISEYNYMCSPSDFAAAGYTDTPVQRLNRICVPKRRQNL